MARAVKKEKKLTPEEKLAQALVPDVEQPYRVPENWCWVTASSLASVISKGTTPQGGKHAYTDTGISFLRVENILDDGTISHENIMHVSEEMHSGFLKRSVLQEGDILVSIAGTLGKTAIIRKYDLPMNTNQAVSFIRLKCEEISRKYVKLAIDTPIIQSHLLSQTKVTAIPNLTLEIIGSCPIPLAPLAEQQRIVDRIESLFAKLDEAKEKAQTVVDGFEDRKAAILHKAFTGELTEEWRQNNGVSRDTWNNYTIGDMFIHTTGKALKKSNTNGSLHKYITTSNLYWGRFDFSEVREMYFTDDELDKCTAKKGDLLICNGGDVGRAAIWNYDYDICIQNHISKLRKKQNNIDVVFCYYFFMLSKIKGKINSKGIGIASLSAKDLLAMPIDVPSIEEQHEISSILNELFNNEQQAKETAERVIDQIDTMKKAILARAFRGELGTNDPNDESAVELLKRILTEGV